MYDDIISPKSSAFINTFILEKSYVVESLKIFLKKDILDIPICISYNKENYLSKILADVIL